MRSELTSFDFGKLNGFTEGVKVEPALFKKFKEKFSDTYLEIRLFCCGACGISCFYFILQRTSDFFVCCTPCDLRYSFNFNTETFNDLGEIEKQFEKPMWEVVID